MREFFGGRRQQKIVILMIALASSGLIASILIGMSLRNAPRPVVYLFHFNLTEAEISTLPSDVATLAQIIQGKTIESFPRTQLDEIIARCPHREIGTKRDRLIWGLDGKAADEGDRSVWMDLDKNGKLLRCGLVFVG